MSQTQIENIFEPLAIEVRSFAIIDEENPEPRLFSGMQWEIARRLLHTSADYELLNHIRFHPLAVQAGLRALEAKSTVLTDTLMAKEGIPLRRRKALGFVVENLMMDAEVAALAQKRGVTRAQVCMEVFASRGQGGIFAIGNAPTALLRLLELIKLGEVKPALIIGMPVGFVNAEQSKELLMGQDEVPYITIAGRKGGSALAAATVNALVEIILREKSCKA